MAGVAIKLDSTNLELAYFYMQNLTALANLQGHKVRIQACLLQEHESLEVLCIEVNEFQLSHTSKPECTAPCIIGAPRGN